MKQNTPNRLKYSSWLKEQRSFLEMFQDKRVIVLFSGGKDSSIILDFILRASLDFQFSFETHAGAFPEHRYIDIEKQKIDSYWKERGVKIHWHEMEQTDHDLKNAENPCKLCQQVRKELLRTLLPKMVDDWERLILITSYSLWDIVSYSIEHLLADILSGPGDAHTDPLSKRFMETGQRFLPFLRMKEGYSVFRPLISYNGDDIINYITKKEVPTISIPCLFKEYRPKRILEKYYEKMGLRFDYNHVLAFAKEALGLPDMKVYDSMDKEMYLKEFF